MYSPPFLSAKLLQMLTLTATMAILLAPLVSSFAPKTSFRVPLHRVDSHQNLTKEELISRAINRARPRVEHLDAAVLPPSDNTSFRSQIHAGNGEYYMDLSIGTPKVAFSAIMDTGSDLIWTQCQPCKKCFPQSIPIFDPSKSSTFANVSCASEFCKEMGDRKCTNGGKNCEYFYGYADQSTTAGYIGTDTVSFGKPGEEVSVPGIGFGCGLDNEGKGLNHGSGLVGLGRGHLSLVSQLGFTKFAYCLATIGTNKTSNIFFGSLAELNHNGVYKVYKKETPLITNPSRPSQYHLSLEGITVGKKLLPLDKSLFGAGTNGSSTGGMMIDSGTTISYLQKEAFEAVKREFLSKIKLEPVENAYPGLELCFKLPGYMKKYHVPRLTFHFKGMDLKLPASNYMLPDTSRGLLCLTIGSSNRAILGNIQQQNMMVLHDLDKETVSFTRARCG